MRRIVIVCAIVGLLSDQAFAGADRELKQGDHIRIRTKDSDQQYTLEKVAPDTLYVVKRGSDTGSRIAVYQVERIDVRVPRSQGAGAAWGAFIGGGVGGAIGMLYAIVTWDEVDADCGPEPVGTFCDTSISVWRFVGMTFVFGFPGMLVGAAVGAANPGHRWQRIELPGTLSVRPRSDGTVVLQYTFSF
jgi:hypothetical protein